MDTVLYLRYILYKEFKNGTASGIWQSNITKLTLVGPLDQANLCRGYYDDLTQSYTCMYVWTVFCLPSTELSVRIVIFMNSVATR